MFSRSLAFAAIISASFLLDLMVCPINEQKFLSMYNRFIDEYTYIPITNDFLKNYPYIAEDFSIKINKINDLRLLKNKSNGECVVLIYDDDTLDISNFSNLSFPILKEQMNILIDVFVNKKFIDMNETNVVFDESLFKYITIK